MNIREIRKDQFDWKRSQVLNQEEEDRRFQQKERQRALELLDTQIATAKRESDPNALIEQYKAILGANRDNELALMNQRAANDLTSQEKMYERMGALAREQAASWLNTNRQLASDSFGFRSKESRQQFEQEKDLQLSSLRENENIERRRRESDRSASMSAFKKL